MLWGNKLAIVLFLWFSVILLQDALCKKHCTDIKLKNIIARSCNTLKDFYPSTVITMSYLEAVAQSRFVLAKIAEFFKSGTITEKTSLLQQLQEVCTNDKINTVTIKDSNNLCAIGPAIFLLKVLLRQYGFPTLNRIFKQHQWIIPKALCQIDEKVLHSTQKPIEFLNGHLHS